MPAALTASPWAGAENSKASRGDRLACAIGCPEVVPPGDHELPPGTHFYHQHRREMVGTDTVRWGSYVSRTRVLLVRGPFHAD